MRDDFPISVRELLQRRAGHVCSNPGCRQPTSGPQEDTEKSVNVGEAAHVTAAAPGGPRYDATLSAEERRSASNGIWLCATCSRLIDRDVQRFSVPLLKRWRQEVEAEAARRLETRMAPQDEPRFARLRRLIPELLNEMERDLREVPFRREFVLLKKANSYWASGSEFFYFTDDHPELHGKVRMLEQSGMVIDITATNAPRFSFTEEFVDLLTKGS